MAHTESESRWSWIQPMMDGCLITCIIIWLSHCLQQSCSCHRHLDQGDTGLSWMGNLPTYKEWEEEGVGDNPKWLITKESNRVHGVGQELAAAIAVAATRPLELQQRKGLTTLQMNGSTMPPLSTRLQPNDIWIRSCLTNHQMMMMKRSCTMRTSFRLPSSHSMLCPVSFIFLTQIYGKHSPVHFLML